MSTKLFSLLAVAAILGCASGGTSETPRSGGPSRQSDLLTAQELVAAHADGNTAYDAVARLRPNWLASKGVTSVQSNSMNTDAQVFVNGVKYGALTSLRDIPAYHVISMRYYDVTQSGARFGIQGGANGVIEVITR